MNLRLRLRWSKLGRIRFCGHRDAARIWERAVRRAEVPVAYTQGFSPRPRISFGLALATGQESVAEYLDIELRVPATEAFAWAEELPARLTAALPAGMEVTGAAPLARGSDSLQAAVTSCTWRFDPAPADDPDRLRDWVSEVRSAGELPLARERKGRCVTEDVRPCIGPLQLGADGVLLAELGTKPRAVRPAEFLRVTSPPLAARRVRRLHQWITRDGDRYEPLASAAGVLQPAEQQPPTSGYRAVAAAQQEVCA